MASKSASRVSVDGKFFRLGESKLYLKGVTYGPFEPDAQNEPFASREQTERDFRQIRELGANLVRIYDVPPAWFLDLAEEHELKVLVDVPWPKHLCFLDSEPTQREARDSVRQAVASCRGHAAIFAFSLVNEIPAEIVRWSGAPRVEAFIDELVNAAKAVDPECLCTFTNFPPTEFLHPRNIDFVCFSVYLHQRKAFENYLARLQMIADTQPLVLAEFGLDSFREGEILKCEFLSWQIDAAFRGGVAGTVVFSFTDDWFRGGRQITDWAFGLTTRDRQPKDSFRAVQKMFRAAPYYPLPRHPKVSVVVASYNGARTLHACLQSLAQLNYPDYEVLLVDDGSTDRTPDIAQKFPNVRTIRQDNGGLSAARNAGIAAATGEIVAFTDSDCRADEDWLYYLIGDLLDGGWVGIGGHNLLPADDSLVAAAVMASPGGPAHVMLTDREAEHIPGCNMAFYKWALIEIGGFDPVFRKAGDDVDLCWRLLECGQSLGFSPAGFVWHYRRSTVKAYLRQQAGYGEAEAFLSRKHPEYFSTLGGSLWRGRIYAAAKPGAVLQRSMIYHGVFGSGFFQKLYSPGPSFAFMLCTSLEYHVLVIAPLFVLSVAFSWLLPLAITSFSLPVIVCGVAAAQAELPQRKQRFWSRPLVALLYFLQPVERGLARYRSRLHIHPVSSTRRARATKLPATLAPLEHRYYWSPGDVDRYAFLHAGMIKLNREKWSIKPDTGWADYDLEIGGHRWSRVRVTTVGEQLDQGRLNLRCRLQSFWSLPAKVLFWSIFAIELVVVSLLAPKTPELWMLPISMSLLYLFLEHEQLSFQQAIASLLDEVAGELNLVKLRYDAKQKKLVPAEKR